MTPLPDHFRQASRARTQEAEKRARTALAQLVKAGKPVSFTSVARDAVVSIDFLYRSPELRSQIERHRTKTGSPPAAPTDLPGDSSTSAAMRALSARLTRQQEAHARRWRSSTRPWQSRRVRTSTFAGVWHATRPTEAAQNGMRLRTALQ
ncbi:DUF6262 family protein [Streptomyces sp. NPDC056549]|uniref:DUF6262 family protein n=1 Tax=Streptomyces sp. NPDC056549 TaxID=3345864 RepID=UPI0036C4286F